MIRISAAALALAFVPAVAFSQATPSVDIPKPKCEKPSLPGPKMMEETRVAKQFKNDVEAYKNCMKAYADERAALAKANSDAGNAAIDEYNNTMKSLQEAQKNR
jgi:methionine synthase II (cobalamin-independent)